MSKTSVVEKWVDEAAALTKPSKVIWADGSKQEYDRLVEDMLRDSTLLELNQQSYPGSRRYPLAHGIAVLPPA